MATNRVEQTKHVHHGAFGSDAFGRAAERFARFFGTPRFLIGQTVAVALWILLNVNELAFNAFDPFPFILLNLMFSTQAAYAAPLILLAQARQADRDKALAEADTLHREKLAAEQTRYLEDNHRLMEQVARLTEEVHAATCGRGR
ncbi:MAG: DUF1003 domain-containing protein [Thermoleophilaceae bacterium]